jgi:soluble lytic murein transglycosylase
MRLQRSVLALLLALLLLPASGVQEGARAEAEEPPAPRSEPSLPAPAPSHPTTLDGVRFDPASVRLDDASPEQRMRAAYDAGQNDRAHAIGAAALPSADALSRGRILWLLARNESASDVLASRLSELAELGHPLSRWAALRLGESLLTRSPARAHALADKLTEGWAGAGRGRMLQALAQRKMGEDRAAEALLRAQLDRAAKTSPAANIAFPLAEILVARGDRESLKQALALYRRVGARGASSDNGEKADKLAAQVLKRLRPKDREEFALPSKDDEFARGQSLMNGHHFEEALALFDKLARRLRNDRDGKCRAELEAGHALFMKRDRVAAHARLSQVARRCTDLDVKAWAHYYAASALQRTGDPKGAIAEYEALVRSAPSHSLADDALYLEAAAQDDAGDPAQMRAVLERMLSLYPHGDMRAEGRFALVLAARARGDYTEALTQLDKLLAEGPAERQEGSEGRAAYWRARTLQDLGRLAEAEAAFVDLARSLPLSYHAQQAMARIREVDPPTYDKLLAELADDAHEPKLSFAWRPELDSAAFKTALEFMRVGEVDLAQQELSWLGATGERADRDMLWLVAAMLHEAHAYADASNLVRSRLRTFRSVPPRGQARQLWRLAYPRAFDPLIEQAASESQVPPEFVRAVAREESNFNPEAVSAALAYGLIQLIRPTAREHARALGLPSDPSSLKKPEINLRIGAHFIRDLWQRYARNPAVVPAAYNAGFFASDKWLAANPGQHLDDWIERIPYRETRRYTRRVLQSYGIYAWLDTGKLPPLPMTLPVTQPPAGSPQAPVLVSAPGNTPPAAAAAGPVAVPAPVAVTPPPAAAPAARATAARKAAPAPVAAAAPPRKPAPRKAQARRPRAAAKAAIAAAVPDVGAIGGSAAPAAGAPAASSAAGTAAPPAASPAPPSTTEPEAAEEPADPDEPIMRISPRAD